MTDHLRNIAADILDHGTALTDALVEGLNAIADELDGAERPVKSFDIIGGNDESINDRILTEGDAPFWFKIDNVDVEWQLVEVFLSKNSEESQVIHTDTEDGTLGNGLKIKIPDSGMEPGTYLLTIVLSGDPTPVLAEASATYVVKPQASATPPPSADHDLGWPIPSAPTPEIVEYLERVADGDGNVQFLKDLGSDGEQNKNKINTALKKVGKFGMVWLPTGKTFPLKGEVITQDEKSALVGYHTIIKDNNPSGTSIRIKHREIVLYGIEFDQVVRRNGGSVIFNLRDALSTGKLGTDTYSVYKKLRFKGNYKDSTMMELIYPELNLVEDIHAFRINGWIIHAHKGERGSGGAVNNIFRLIRSHRQEGTPKEAFLFEDVMSSEWTNLQVLVPEKDNIKGFAGIRLKNCHSGRVWGSDTEAFAGRTNDAWGVVLEGCHATEVGFNTTWHTEQKIRLQNGCKRCVVRPIREATGQGYKKLSLSVDASCRDTRYFPIEGQVDVKDPTAKAI